MRERVADFETRLGTKETRLYFSEWLLDGATVPGVTVFPHPCGTCVGGDHTHVDTLQTPVRLRDTEVELRPDEVAAISAYLRASRTVNDLTQDFFARLRHERVCT